MNRLLLAALIVSCAAAVYGAFTPDAAPPSTIALTAASLADPAPVEPAEPAAPEPAPLWLSYAEAYEQAQATRQPLVVLFGMDGCAPCADVKAEIESAKEDCVLYCYVDIAREPEVAKNFGYVTPGFSVPQTYVYHSVDGEWKVAHFSGRPVRGAIAGAIRSAKAGVKRVAQVAKAVVEKPVEFVQERQPVRRVIRRLCPNCR